MDESTSAKALIGWSALGCALLVFWAVALAFFVPHGEGDGGPVELTSPAQ